MKISKEGNKIIIELEPKDAGPLPLNVAVDAWYMGMKMMIENPSLMMEAASNYQTLVPDQIKDSGESLLQGKG